MFANRMGGGLLSLVQDENLHWVDALTIDDQRRLWLPVAQLDRAPIFHGGESQVERPIRLYWVSFACGAVAGRISRANTHASTGTNPEGARCCESPSDWR